MHLQARMLPLFRHYGNLFSSLSFPFGSREKKDKEESVVWERKLIFLALCYSFVSFLFLFSFSPSFTALKLMCLLKCLFNDFSLFISVGGWENESVVGKESLSFCTIQISLNFLGLPFFWFWGNIEIKIRNTFFFFAKQTLHPLLSNLFWRYGVPLSVLCSLCLCVITGHRCLLFGCWESGGNGRKMMFA